MAGQKIVLSGVTFTDNTLPVLRADGILSAGSLFLFDLGHSQGKVTGMPITGTPIPNVAFAEAAAILGSGSSATLAGSFLNNAQAADALFERTSKLGIQGIYSQINNSNTSRGAQINVATPIRDYMIANKTHLFYISVWARRTRAAIATGHRFMEIGGGGTYLGFLAASGATSKVAGTSKIVGGINTVANRLAAMTAQAGSADTVSAVASAMTFGNIGSGSALGNQCPSDIFYRGYCEDLTVSGRTFAQVEALDEALWTAAFATGGKFNNDTYTAASAFP